MAYDWQAELRKYLVRPNQDLSKGGQFSIRTGGTITLRRGTNNASFNGGAEYNIDLIEIFTLRSAIDSGGVSISQKDNSPRIYKDYRFAFYTAAICDFHNIPHAYQPPRIYASDYRDAWERVVAYLEEKYSEQPRPILNISKASLAEAAAIRSTQRPIAIVFYVLFALWICTVIMGQGAWGFVILFGAFVAFVFILYLMVRLIGLKASLDLPKRLARFVLLSMNAKKTPPPSAPDDNDHPPTIPPSDPKISSSPEALTEPATEPQENKAAILPTTPMARLTEQQQAILREIEAMVNLMDNALKIPIINRTVGIDPLLGMVWGLGGMASLLPAGYVIIRAGTLGVPSDKLVSMVRNVVVDTAVGAVPVAGQLTDFIIKANTANLNIIYAHFGLPPYKKRR